MDGGEAARRINPILMRFRPIAPKPVAGGVASAESKNASMSRARMKRKYVRVRRYNRKKKIVTAEQVAVTTATTKTTTATTKTTTLQLPECTGGGSNLTAVGGEESGVGLGLDPKRELWVTVECVTDACMEEVELGCTDEERRKNLEEDTCPGFVSDGSDRVEWLNGAFRRMVRQRSGGCEGEIGVRLVISDIPKRDYLKRVFTCQIKLQFKRGTEMEKDTKLVPCDAWRMDGGGFAWKLDVKAALTLAPLLQEDFH